MKRLVVQNKMSLLLKSFYLQIWNSNYVGNVKRSVYKELKEVFAKSHKSLGFLIERSQGYLT